MGSETSPLWGRKRFLLPGDPDQEYIYFLGSKRLLHCVYGRSRIYILYGVGSVSACYILFCQLHSIPFYGIYILYRVGNRRILPVTYFLTNACYILSDESSIPFYCTSNDGTITAHFKEYPFTLRVTGTLLLSSNG